MVYVDDMRAPFGRMIMCHLIADTSAQLFAMVSIIGVQARWVQQVRTSEEHFDICLSKRARAVAAGAIEISWRELALKCRDRRGRYGPHTQADTADTSAYAYPVVD